MQQRPSAVEQMEHKISELEDRNFEITQWKAKRKKWKEEKPPDLWDPIKRIEFWN